MRQAIDTLLDDAETRSRMGRAGRDAVRDELSIETYAARVQRMYLAAAETRRRSVA
jgi:glycosyltransferase involved in cell wall biosynthesis